MRSLSFSPANEEGFNKRDLTVFDGIIATSLVWNNKEAGVEGWKLDIAAVFASPDTHHTLDEMIAEGDKMAFRATYGCTQEGERSAIPPTGKEFTSTATAIYHNEIVDSHRK